VISFSISWPPFDFGVALLKDPHVRGLVTRRLHPQADATQEIKFAIKSNINQHMVFYVSY
jgi:hypothetical protein